MSDSVSFGPTFFPVCISINDDDNFYIRNKSINIPYQTMDLDQSNQDQQPTVGHL